MGARESRSQREGADDDGSTPQDDDYYTILELDEDASADEIRVSFVLVVYGIKRGSRPVFRIMSLLRRNGISQHLLMGDHSVRSDASRSYIIPTRILMTLRARRDASPHYSKPMRYAFFYHSLRHGQWGLEWPLVQSNATFS